MLSRLSVFSIKKSIPLVTSVRCGHWNKHWKAGPYPKTEEERIAAAKKYNLLPEEYEPYEDDGWGWGDYPKLPPISIINKDHWEPWTCPEDRRDYCEPLIIYEHILAEDRGEWPITDPGVWGIPFWKQWLCFLGAVGTCVILFNVPQKYNFINCKPFLARHIPEPGKVHYTYAHRSPDLIYKH
nr:PREDICTED: NADH dehydrogenase [ubiquinone] 1 beta subcomplex subunit 8, mitochondrial [Bemisia tabaci]